MTRALLWGILLCGAFVMAEESESRVWDKSIESNSTQEVDIYTRNCIPCHEYLPSSLERMFMSYLKVYSGEFTVKESLKAYLRQPDPDVSVMSKLFRDRFGIKYETDLSDEELDEAVNIYWEKYDVRKKLK